MNHPRNCQVNIGEIEGIPVLLPDNMTSQDIVSIALSSRHQRKLLDAGIWGINRIEQLGNERMKGRLIE